MLGEFSGKEETDSGLHLSAGESLLLVIADEAGSFTGDLLEDVVNERVHDGHGFLGDTSFGVNLLQDTVDIDGESLDATLVVSLLDNGGGSLGGGSSS